MTSYLGNDTTAAIAWAGTGKCDYRALDSLNLDCYFYCVITGAGNPWKLSLCSYEHFQFGERFLIVMNELGKLDVNLNGKRLVP